MPNKASATTETSTLFVANGIATWNWAQRRTSARRLHIRMHPEVRPRVDDVQAIVVIGGERAIGASDKVSQGTTNVTDSRFPGLTKDHAVKYGTETKSCRGIVEVRWNAKYRHYHLTRKPLNSICDTTARTT
ncbi:hypothetical protein PBRA_007871 [Plasmodiophora brassicae]|uniref:Uncharacterized protein n=1 Tax=Plasmodiophora brassicae TaxID=37360 RepID=A0A0G4IY44_PLABS|nr:hypothetical protein PBRA_007871 [Plasmodiophora brassicae]